MIDIHTFLRLMLGATSRCRDQAGIAFAAVVSYADDSPSSVRCLSLPAAAAAAAAASGSRDRSRVAALLLVLPLLLRAPPFPRVRSRVAM